MPDTPKFDEEPDDFYGDDEDEGSEIEFDCHMDIHGNCGKAGSEECDFECPYQDVKRKDA